MGNENNSTKKLVLDFLRKHNEPYSGEKIAEEIGISRVSIWKAVQSLTENGYGISSGRKGYLLENDKADSIDPWEFGQYESFFNHLSVTESTMNEAWSLATGGKLTDGEIHLITTDAQTKGKGRGEHLWETTKDSLAFTLVANEKTPVMISSRWIMAAQISMAEVLTKLAGRKFYVRWPNDIWSEKGKVSGILDEYKVSGGFSQFMNLGIGVNVSSGPEGVKSDWVLRENENRNHVSRKVILEEFINHFEQKKQLIKLQDESLENIWNRMCFDLRENNTSENYSFNKIDRFGFAEINMSGNIKTFAPGTFTLKK